MNKILIMHPEFGFGDSREVKEDGRKIDELLSKINCLENVIQQYKVVLLQMRQKYCEAEHKQN